MGSILEPYLALLEQHPERSTDAMGSDRLQDIADAVEIQLAVFEALQRRIGPGGLSDAYRHLIPMFNRWVHSARELLKSAGVLRATPFAKTMERLGFAINRAKLVTEDFDEIVRLNKSDLPGQNGPYKSLDEVKSGLRPAS